MSVFTMLRRPWMGMFAILVVSSACTQSQADTVFFDDFEAYPVSNPSDFSATGNWVYNGFAGDANTDRVFFSAPNYGGTTLWITGPANVSAGINGTGIPVVANTDYTFSAALVMETFDGTRTAEATVDLLVGTSLGTATSLLGSPATFTARGDTNVPGGVAQSYDDQRSEIVFNSGAIGAGNMLFATITYSAAVNNPGFFGVDEIRLFEENGFEDVPQVVVNRDTGNVRLNNFTSSDVSLLGYSLLSASGSFDQTNWLSIANNYDQSSGGEVDSNNNWTILTDPNSHGDLSEAELQGGDGGTIAGGGPAGDSVDLGNVWIRSRFEDITAEFLIPVTGELRPIQVVYEGNNGLAFAPGDLAGSGLDGGPDGMIDLADWIAFKAGFGSSLTGLSTTQAYLASDLTGDGMHSLEDLAAFETAYDDANGLGAFQAMLSGSTVPEPATWAFALLGMVALVGYRFSHRIRLQPAIATVVGVAIFAMANVSQAVPLTQANSADFDFLYEMNAPLGTLDLDANTSADWFNGTAGGLTQPTVTGGFGNSNQTAVPAEILWRTDAGGTLNRATVTGEFTMEISIQLLGGQDVDDVGTFGIALQQPLQGQSLRLNLAANEVSFNGGGVNAVATGDNTDGQHTFRIAYENGGANGGTDDAYWIWRDDVLLNSTPNTPFVGSNGSFNNGGSWFLGDFTGSISGEWTVDYIRVADQALSPVGGATSGPLTLAVNTATGEAVITNTFDTPLEFSSYSINSDSGSLVGTSLNSLENNPSFGDGTPNNGVGWETLTAGNSLIAEANLLGSSTFALNDSVNLGNIFNSSASPIGDYNGDNEVDAADYTVWRDTLGQSGAGLAADGNGDNMITSADYDLWRQNFGSTGGGGSGALASEDLTFRFRLIDGTILNGLVVDVTPGSLAGSASAVPEPATLGLFVLAGAIVLAVRSTRLKKAASLLFAITLVGCFASNAMAVITYDRLYEFGDPGTAETTLGANIGNGNALGYPGGGGLRSADEAGDNAVLVSFTDLNNTGGTYASVATRPGADANDFGARFNGTSDFLVTTRSLNAPSQFWDNAGDVDDFFPNSDFPYNYEGIFAHGIQLWAQPNVPALSAGNRQDLILDTGEHGVFITAGGNWGLQFDDAGIDTGVSVASTLDSNGWAHVMEISGFSSRVNGGTSFGGALLVNGVAVAAQGTFYDPEATPMSVGANQAGTSNFYNGVIDDLGVFFWGDNSNQLGADGVVGGTNSSAGLNADGQNWGTLNLGTDNGWISNQLSVLGVTNPGDVNLDTFITSADEAAFVDGWLSQNIVGGQLIGDWNSRQNGDLNYDGIVNLADAFILHEAMVTGGLGGLDFSALSGGSNVPEPGSVLLGLLGVGLVIACRRSRRLRSPIASV